MSGVIKTATDGSKTIVSLSFPFWTVLFFVLLVMKLAGVGAVAGWSWWLVTAPLWAPPAAVLGLLGAFMIVVLGFFALVAGVAWLADKRSW